MSMITSITCYLLRRFQPVSWKLARITTLLSWCVDCSRTYPYYRQALTWFYADQSHWLNTISVRGYIWGPCIKSGVLEHTRRAHIARSPQNLRARS